MMMTMSQVLTLTPMDVERMVNNRFPSLFGVRESWADITDYCDNIRKGKVPLEDYLAVKADSDTESDHEMSISDDAYISEDNDQFSEPIVTETHVIETSVIDTPEEAQRYEQSEVSRADMPGADKKKRRKRKKKKQVDDGWTEVTKKEKSPSPVRAEYRPSSVRAEYRPSSVKAGYQPKRSVTDRTTIFVSSIGYMADKSEIYTIFANFGKIVNFNFLQAKRKAFIKYENEYVAKKVLSQCGNIMYRGFPIKVEYAKSKY